MRNLFRQRKTDFLNGIIYRQILLFFFPVFFGTLFQQLYNTVDAIVVGNAVGKEALGAVGGSTGTVINLLVNFVAGLSSGATVVVAQYYGRGERSGVRKGVDAGMALSLVLGGILSLAGIASAPYILRLLNVPAEIFPYSLSYMRIYFAGLLPTLIYNTGAAVLRAVGDSRRPLYFLIVSCVINIVLDIVLVAVVHMGVEGAAAATIIAQSVSCFLILRTLKMSHDCYQFSFRDMHLDFSVLKQILIIGLPTGIQSMLYSVANLFIQASVNGYGTDTVAAYTAFGKIDAMFWNYSGALGTSVMTFCGQNYGAGRVDRVHKGIRQSFGIYLIGSTLISTFCLLFARPIYRLFTADASVIDIGVSLMRFIAPFWGTFVGVEILSSSIRSCGDSLVPMIITALGIGLLRIVWIVGFPGKTVFDTLLCYPVSWILTSLLFIGYYLQGGWQKRASKQRNRLIQNS